MDFLMNYSTFLAKTATMVIAILILFGCIMSIAAKAKEKGKGKLRIKKINDQYDEMADIINTVIQSKFEIKQQKKADRQAKKKQKAKGKVKKSNPRIFVIHFQGDLRASAVAGLREEITAILLTARRDDRVLCCLESPGGMVNAYGLAASQLCRLKDAHINLVIAVDKVAASGGYMMACVADEIIAAPFAVIGSIGVIAQLPNFHRLLDKKNVEFEQITAGEYKRTLTMFGKNTSKGREKMQEEIDDLHILFKSFVQEHRSKVDINKVATGEHWLATRALDLNLVDQLKTSDDYLLSAKKDGFDIYTVVYHIKKSFGKRISESASFVMGKLMRYHLPYE